jgi:predicted short-subunit dehydrogenase-like oxidoreductase (DUF2520 family)
MRELERDSSTETPACTRVAIVGAGRLGRAIAGALAGAPRYELTGPLGREAAPVGVDVVLLCVPDAEIAVASALIPVGPAVGHCSGASGLELLDPHEMRFSIHPLMTVTADGARFAGAGAAVAGSCPRAVELACDLARALRMRC